MSGTTLAWDYVLGTQKVWIDVVVFVVFAAVHAAANWNSPNLSAEPQDRAAAFGFVKEMAGTSVTVVGILLPLSLAAIGTLAGKSTVPSRVLANIFIADTWLALSLTFGLLALWTASYRALTENVQNRRGVRLLNGWALAAILVGVVRLLIATFFLVEGGA